MFSMKIAITQRICKNANHDELMDCLDINWAKFLISLNFIPMPIPFVSPANIDAIWDAVSPDGLILSGGNDIDICKENSEEMDEINIQRDQFELALIKKAITCNIPILGICRGLQLINIFFGGSIRAIDGHVGCNHSIYRTASSDLILTPSIVNSYHKYCIPNSSLGEGLIELAHDSDGNIEAAYSERQKILGIMWHPEREDPASRTDVKTIKEHFEKW